MSPITPEWIMEFFNKSEDFFVTPMVTLIGNAPASFCIDGHLSPQELAEFLNEKISEHYSYLE